MAWPGRAAASTRCRLSSRGLTRRDRFDDRPHSERLGRAGFRNGYGTYEPSLRRRDREWYVEILIQAIRCGFRHFDSAQMYGTEEMLGDAIRRSGIDRTELFVATKLDLDVMGYDDVLRAAEESRRRLGVEIIDLFYVHVPVETYDPTRT